MAYTHSHANICSQFVNECVSRILNELFENQQIKSSVRAILSGPFICSGESLEVSTVHNDRSWLVCLRSSSSTFYLSIK